MSSEPGTGLHIGRASGSSVAGGSAEGLLKRNGEPGWCMEYKYQRKETHLVGIGTDKKRACWVSSAGLTSLLHYKDFEKNLVTWLKNLPTSKRARAQLPRTHAKAR